MRLLYIFLPIVLVMLFSACTKTVEGEKKRWKNNIEKIEFLSQKHPTYKAIIADIQKEAEHLYAKALTVQDEEERIEKMADANKLLNPPFVRGLKAFDEKAEKVKELNKKIVELSSDETNAIVAAINSVNLEQEISDARATIRSSEPLTLDAANKIVSGAMKPIEDRIDEMKKIVRELEKLERERQSN